MPTIPVMDAISSLVGGMQAAQLRVNVAADMLAKADLPVAPSHGTPAVATDPSTAVDVSEQLTTLMISADQHTATTAALRQALTAYQSAVDILMGS